MRYQEALEETERVASVSTDMMLATVVYTLLLGIGFVLFGLRVGKLWVTFWGSTMVLAGIVYLGAILGGAG